MKLQKTIFFVCLLFLFFSVEAQNIVINEIITSNSTVNTDDDGSYEDWVELYNNGTESINLLGYGLSDNDNLFKWVFPNYSIQPGEHLLVWCSNKNRTNPDFPLHTNFAISAGGETISLTFPDGTIADQVPAIVIPQNFSYGRAPSGSSTFLIFQEPTPGTFNPSEGAADELSAPQFSINSGFYNDSFTLTISHPDPEVTILYSLDGSEPKAENLGGKSYLYKNQYEEFSGQETGELLEESFSTLNYNAPIEIVDRSELPNKIASISSTFHQNPFYIPDFPVFKGTVVRAKAIKEGTLSSETITKTYFISPEESNRYTIPVVSISLDEEHFFDYENGIYVAGKDFDDWRLENPTVDALWSNANYKRSGDETEKKAHFSFFENGNEIINQNIGVRIHGGFTRISPNKSLRLYARSEYGSSTFNHTFFENSSYSSFKRLILRNSGNDVSSTYFRDAFIQRTVNHLNFDTQAYQPTITFLNGEYWGILNMRERFDRHYFERVYNIADGDLDFLEYNGFLVQEGDYEHYAAMLGFIENNNLNHVANYNYVATQMDTENYTDHFIANIYARNTDWPHNNIEFWRKRTEQYEPDAPYGQDGRWRWVLKDTDFGFGGDGGSQSYEHNTLAFATSIDGDENTNPEWSTLILRKLLENTAFKNNFINRFADLLNTTYLPERVIGIINEMKSGIEAEIQEHRFRWSTIGSMEQWQSNIDVMIEFSNERPAHQRNHILEKFEIESTLGVQINVSDEDHGYIKINTIEILPTTPGVQENPYPWLGVYFKNIPITLKAIAKPGYVFSHWSGASVSPEAEITIFPKSNIQLTAHFIPSEEEEIAPIYFWVMDNSVPNDTALTEINSSFEMVEDGLLRFESCLEGYPFDSSHPNWRKASMERRNSPTDLNYIPEANNDLPFESANMRGLQIKQPFQHNGMENQLIFEFSSFGYKDILLGFAAKDENAADAILVDYSILENTPVWTTEGLATTSFGLFNEYQLYEVDFSSIEAVNNNPNLKIRLRFEGENMTQDNGDRVTFNNFSIKGVPETFDIADPIPALQFNIYPNPVSEELYIVHGYNEVDYKLFSVDGKLVQNGLLQGLKINVSNLQSGLYILQLEVDGKKEIKKIVKK
ncbi:CotH kinase family protein [Flavobacterium azooxidireducens]|uniref:CotH kinase family protein n=1 Tax=Flavobacterium azooxidireducens TaxID=1871076 RepID=A0ABY4KI81_9FLAO|nr:CotH kinase family protein [Flavobacterium azooxidireducens]UPQ80523.1 CotH kinase family protein [Flavobacterium azooxidireducens]